MEKANVRDCRTPFRLRAAVMFIAFTVCVFLPVSRDACKAEGRLQVELQGGGVAVFTRQHGGDSMAALSREAAASVARMFDRCGRFIPVEEYRLRWAFQKTMERMAPGADFHHETARMLNADLYILVSITQRGNTYTGKADVIPLVEEYRHMRRNIEVQSGIMMNIPLKLARGIAELHRTVPLRFRVIRNAGAGLYIIDAGQWHGVEKRKYVSLGGNTIDIVSTGRYESVCRLAAPAGKDPYVVPVYPRIDRLVGKVNMRIEEYTLLQRSIGNTLLKAENPEKRYIEGMCIINPGSNICIPGYGSFLAAHYLGFREKSPDLPGVVGSTVLLAGHFLLVPVMTGFKGHFFPWVNDGDKNESERKLQVYLWATVPFTVTAAYLDQLAYLFQDTDTLPPFFKDRDVMAAVMSVVVPGGGLFYKGYRYLGWGYYSAEMGLAGFGVYSLGAAGSRGVTFLALAGLVKLVEICHACLAGPNYKVYRRETASAWSGVRFLAGGERTAEGEAIYRIGVGFRYGNE